MAATTHGTGLTFGLTAESTGFIQNFECQDKTEKVEVRNETGEFAGFTTYNRTQELSGEIILNAASPYTPGSTITSFANWSGTGLITCEEVTTKQTNTGYKTISFKAFCYPLVTT